MTCGVAHPLACPDPGDTGRAVGSGRDDHTLYRGRPEAWPTDDVHHVSGRRDRA